MMRNGQAVHIDTAGIDGLIAENPKWGFSNLDLIADRKGRFLVQEWKREGEKLTDGQRILLESLARNSAFTVWIVSGDTDDGIMKARQVWEMRNGTPVVIARGLQAFQESIRVWYHKADRGEL
tara:strand:- start:257 stop:625 length:369 start_codon:yes stop_codon:yes gene_type:complete